MSFYLSTDDGLYVQGWIKVTDVTQKQMALQAQRSKRRSSSSQMLSLGDSPDDGEETSHHHRIEGRPPAAGTERTTTTAAAAGLLETSNKTNDNKKAGEVEYENPDDRRGEKKKNNNNTNNSSLSLLGTSGNNRTPSLRSDTSEASTRCSWNGSEIDTPVISIAPPMQRWVVETVVIHLYVLTGRNLLNVDLFGKSDPYLKVCLGDQTIISDNVFDK